MWSSAEIHSLKKQYTWMQIILRILHLEERGNSRWKEKSDNYECKVDLQPCSCVLLRPLIFRSNTTVNLAWVQPFSWLNSEVVTSHCLLFQQWPYCHIRQCSSRAATKLSPCWNYNNPNSVSRWLAPRSSQTRTSCDKLVPTQPEPDLCSSASLNATVCENVCV